MIKKLKSFLFLSALAFAFSLVAYAQDVVVPPTLDEVSALVASLGGLGGMGVLGVIAVVIQGLMLLLRTPLAAWAGKWRLLIVLALSLVGGVIALVARGTPLLAALLHATTLAALQVLVHQIVKQVSEPAAPPAKA